MEPEKDYNLTVGRRIREVREADRMTRAQFSEKCGISESFLAAVESGKNLHGGGYVRRLFYSGPQRRAYDGCAVGESGYHG